MKDLYGKEIPQSVMDAYEIELKAFEDMMYKRQPMRENYSSDAEYMKAYRAWDMALSCDAPNRPGYYRANND